MKTSSLSTEQAPPISVPLRFFAVAPLFLLLAGLILLTGDANPFADRHTPALLAATHCITLGFMATIMLGAMQQILPVVIGSPMPASRLVAWFSFLPLLAGTLALAVGFLLGVPLLLNLAWLLLAFAFLIFIGASLISLARAAAQNVTRTAIFLSVLALSGAVTLGASLTQGYASGWSLKYTQLAAAHISLALGGWVMLLIVCVSYQVVPMFQLTPNYPRWLTISLTPALFTALLLNLASCWLDAAPLTVISELLFWLFAIVFAGMTLRLQSQRRRRVADATLNFFRLGMVSLLCSALFLLLPESFRMLSAVAFLLGFALSVIHGMLYKIVPFLVWFHLFRGGIKKGVPNMKEIIPEVWMWRHLWLHIATLIATLLAVFWQPAVWLTALGLSLQGILLGFAMFTSIAVYRRTLKQLEQP